MKEDNWLPYPEYEPPIKGLYLVTVVADWGKGKIKQVTLARWNESDQAFYLTDAFRRLHDVQAFMPAPNPFTKDSEVKPKEYKCKRCNGSGRAWITSRFGNKKLYKCHECDGYGYKDSQT